MTIQHCLGGPHGERERCADELEPTVGQFERARELHALRVQLGAQTQVLRGLRARERLHIDFR